MLDERIIEKLSAYADGELDAQAAGEFEQALGQDAGLGACLAQFRQLDRATAQLPVPRLSAEAGEALWEAVRVRTIAGGEAEPLSAAGERRLADHLAMPPAVPEERWQKAWDHIRAQTSDAGRRPVAVDLTPGPMRAVGAPDRAQAGGSSAPIPLWRGFMALAAAALVMFVATMAFLRQVEPHPGGKPVQKVTELTAPEALDDRYFVMVKHVPGIEEPVVCFFLKEPDPELDDFESFQ